MGSKQSLHKDKQMEDIEPPKKLKYFIFVDDILVKCMDEPDQTEITEIQEKFLEYNSDIYNCFISKKDEMTWEVLGSIKNNATKYFRVLNEITVTHGY